MFQQSRYPSTTIETPYMDLLFYPYTIEIQLSLLVLVLVPVSSSTALDLSVNDRRTHSKPNTSLFSPFPITSTFPNINPCSTESSWSGELRPSEM